MTYPLYNFNGTQSGTDPQAQAGLAQYIAQGQQGISPGQAQIAAASPVSAAGQANLAKALQMASQANPAQPVDPSQAALTNGALMQPNSPSGENMGGVGPTVNNAAAMQGYQGMTTQQPTYAQQLGNYLQNMFSGSDD